MDEHRRIERAARARNEALLAEHAARGVELPERFLAQAAHLTVPATVWKYVEGAATRSDADLVMLDLEDSIPLGDDAALARGRENIVRALLDLDWGRRLRFFRPRGLALDPGHEDLAHVVARAGHRLDGLVYPKAEGADEVRSLDATLDALEAACGLPSGVIRVELLIESVVAEEHAFAIAAATRRLVGLVFGAFDYWSSLGLPADAYRFDHPLLEGARARVVRAAASVGVPAIAEMTASFPAQGRPANEQEAARAECRRDAEHAKRLGFRGKWTGIPAQSSIVRDVFAPDDAAIARAVAEVRAYQRAEREGRGAILLDGRMHDRANDRVSRVALERAWAAGRLDADVAAELGVGRGRGVDTR